MPINMEIFIQADRLLVWKAWTESDRIMEWFAPLAEIEPKVNGKFELFFDPSNKESMSTKGCKIIQCNKPELLQFEWKAPDEFVFMNNVENLTSVTIRLSEEKGSTRLTLTHEEFLETPEWVQAKEWHIQAWNQMLQSLKSKIEIGEGTLCCK